MPMSVLGKLLASAFDLYVTSRQHKRFDASHEPSPRVAAIVPQQKFVQAQAYCLAKSSFKIVTSLFQTFTGAFITLTFVAPKIWFFVSSYSGGSELRQTLLFAAAFGLLGLILELPDSIYSTFFLEARYGFNRTTPATFVLDIFKEIALSAVLGVPILSALYHVLRILSAYSPITVALGLWLLVSVLLITMIVLYPSVIAPLFNKFDPLPEGELKNKLIALAKRLHFPLDKMYVIDGSRRSSHSNAYIFGLFKKYICIYDSLLEQTNGKDDQVVSVLCHELGHWQFSHLGLGLAISLSQVFITSFLYGLTAGNPDLFKSFGYGEDMPHVIGLLLFNELLSPIDAILTPLQNMLSRHFEYQADAFAKDQGMAEELGEALVGISVSNLSNMSPDPLYSAWNYSHPTLLERLDALSVSPSTKKDQ